MFKYDSGTAWTSATIHTAFAKKRIPWWGGEFSSMSFLSPPGDGFGSVLGKKMSSQKATMPVGSGPHTLRLFSIKETSSLSVGWMGTDTRLIRRQTVPCVKGIRFQKYFRPDAFRLQKGQAFLTFTSTLNWIMLANSGDHENGSCQNLRNPGREQTYWNEIIIWISYGYYYSLYRSGGWEA